MAKRTSEQVGNDEFARQLRAELRQLKAHRKYSPHPYWFRVCPAYRATRFPAELIGALQEADSMHLFRMEQIGGLPPEFAQLTGLRRLKIHAAAYPNPIAVADWERFILQQTQLEELEIECGNFIPQLEAAYQWHDWGVGVLARLAQLRGLTLRGFLYGCSLKYRQTAFLDGLARCTQLERLTLHRSSVRGDLDALAGLQRLQSLEISNCPNLRTVPEFVYQLPQLRTLWLGRALVHQLEARIFRLPKLKTLHFSIKEQNLTHEFQQAQVRLFCKKFLPKPPRLACLAWPLLTRQTRWESASGELLGWALRCGIPFLERGAIAEWEWRTNPSCEALLESSARVVVLGAFQMGRETLVQRLQTLGVQIAASGSESVTHVVAGEGAVLGELVERGLPILGEGRLVEWFFQREDRWLGKSGSEFSQQLLELLESVDAGACATALTLIEEHGCPPIFRTDLLGICLAANHLRMPYADKALRCLQLYAPPRWARLLQENLAYFPMYGSERTRGRLVFLAQLEGVDAGRLLRWAAHISGVWALDLLPYLRDDAERLDALRFYIRFCDGILRVESETIERIWPYLGGLVEAHRVEIFGGQLDKVERLGAFAQIRELVWRTRGQLRVTADWKRWTSLQRLEIYAYSHHDKKGKLVYINYIFDNTTAEDLPFRVDIR